MADTLGHAFHLERSDLHGVGKGASCCRVFDDDTA
jgi:hypothetical protein